MFRLTVAPNADQAVGDALEQYLTEKLGPKIQANARRTVPVRSGDLKKSIVIQVHAAGPDSTLQVGVDQDIAGVDYGTFVELGTSRAAAQPYMRPAVLQAGGTIV